MKSYKSFYLLPILIFFSGCMPSYTKSIDVQPLTSLGVPIQEPSYLLYYHTSPSYKFFNEWRCPVILQSRDGLFKLDVEVPYLWERDFIALLWSPSYCVSVARINVSHKTQVKLFTTEEGQAMQSWPLKEDEDSLTDDEVRLFLIKGAIDSVFYYNGLYGTNRVFQFKTRDPPPRPKHVNEQAFYDRCVFDAAKEMGVDLEELKRAKWVCPQVDNSQGGGDR